MYQQLFFASACIRCGLHVQAQLHLRRALGCANVMRDRHAMRWIMTALNHVRGM